MIIGDRLRTIREAKNLSQGDVERRSGLLRCYISRVENGHTVPAIETLERIARALGVPLYQILAPDEPSPTELSKHGKSEWGYSGKSAHYMHRLTKQLSRISNRHRTLIMDLLNEMNRPKVG